MPQLLFRHFDGTSSMPKYSKYFGTDRKAEWHSLEYSNDFKHNPSIKTDGF